MKQSSELTESKIFILNETESKRVFKRILKKPLGEREKENSEDKVLLGK